MFFVIWILLILLGMKYKSSKKLAVLQMAFAVLMFSILEGTADYGNYQMILQGINENISSIFKGNVLFNAVLYIFGFANSYNVVLFFVSVTSMFIIYKSIIFYTDNISIVLSFYLLAPFVIDAVQVKNFIAMAVWSYFTRFLYKAYLGEKKWYNTCMYILGVTISLGFHFSFVVMYFFVLIPWMQLKLIIAFFSGFGILVQILVETNIIDYLIEIVGKFKSTYFVYLVSKINDYIDNFNYYSMKTRLQLTMILYLSIVAMLVIFFILKKRNITENQKNILQFLINLNVLSAVIFPLMVYSMEIYRIQRNMLLVNYAVILGFKQDKIYSNGKIRVVSFYTFIFCFIISLYYLYFDCIYWNYDSVFHPFFKF